MATPLNDGLWKLRKAAQCDADMQAVQEHVLKLESENRGLRQDLADRTAQARRQQVTIDEMTARLARHVDERRNIRSRPVAREPPTVRRLSKSFRRRWFWWMRRTVCDEPDKWAHQTTGTSGTAEPLGLVAVARSGA